MKTNTGIRNVETDRRTNKQGLADRYGVGIRTVENWLAWGIIVGRIERGELLMDVEDCDQRLKQLSNGRAKSQQENGKE